MTIGLRPPPAAGMDVESLVEVAEQAFATGEEEGAIPIVRAGAEKHRDALLWQWTALLQRALDDHEGALQSFAEAARLAPDNVKIAQGFAQTAMEAGLPAVELFQRARSLAPRNGAILVGLAAARAAVGDGERAASDLRDVVDRAPSWTYGHEQLGQLLSTLGRANEATSSLEHAIQRFPTAAGLWEALLHVQLRRGAYESLREIVERARTAGVSLPEFAIYEAIHAAEYSDDVYPPALFDAAPPQFASALETWRIRHLLRLGALEPLLPLIDQGLKGAHSHELWAYAATAWRMAQDARSEWLEADESLVQVIDLSLELPPLDELAATLRALHLARGEYLDQSVRGGTQTDGPLFSRVDPVIRHLRQAVARAVTAYVAQLPPVDPDHPLLRHRRDRTVRFSGSWSVRLRSGGHHSNHVHPQGWISSALYVALPERTSGEADDAGWLTLGEPDEKLRLDLGPRRKIEPMPGQLVLFPSWMWHGTRSFAKGERLTVAFDVAPPI
jgi:tetratricopeptide (TPR) repeat protein